MVPLTGAEASAPGQVEGLQRVLVHVQEQAVAHGDGLTPARVRVSDLRREEVQRLVVGSVLGLACNNNTELCSGAFRAS